MGLSVGAALAPVRCPPPIAHSPPSSTATNSTATPSRPTPWPRTSGTFSISPAVPSPPIPSGELGVYLAPAGLTFTWSQPDSLSSPWGVSVVPATSCPVHSFPSPVGVFPPLSQEDCRSPPLPQSPSMP